MPQDTHLDLALSESEEKFVVALVWPNHACHRAVLEELVANGLLLAPLASNLVNEYDVIGLSYGNLLIVR